MAEERYISQEYSSSRQQDKSIPDVVIYSITGDRHPVEAFDKAMAQFDKPGNLQYTTPTGFTALPKGSVPEVVRGLYEKGNALVQRANQWVQQALPGPKPGGGLTPEMVADQRPGASLMQILGGIGKGLSQFGAENVNTPEKAAMTAGLTALGVGPQGRALRQMSGPLPTVARAGMAGVASGAASLATGTGASEPPQTPVLQRAAVQPLILALSVAGTEGAFGILRSVMGRSLPIQANNQVRQDIITSMIKAHPELKLSGDQGLEKYLSTPGGLEIAIRAGVKAVKAEGNVLGREFIEDMNSVLSLKLTKSEETIIKNHLDEHNTLVTRLFDNLGNEKLEATLQGKMDQIKGEITTVIGNRFKSGSPMFQVGGQIGTPLSTGVPDTEAKRLSALKQMWGKYADAQERFAEFREVLKALKVSGEGTGFDARRFQNHVRSRLLSVEGLPDSPLMDDVLRASVRGGQIGSVDQKMGINLGAIPNWIIRDNQRIPLGTRYQGTVKGTPAIVPLDIVIANGISSFLNRTPEKKP